MWKMHLHDECVSSEAVNLDLQQVQTLLNTTCTMGCYSTVRDTFAHHLKHCRFGQFRVAEWCRVQYIYEILYWNIMDYMKHENHFPGAIRGSWRSGAVFRLARVSLKHVVSSQRFVLIPLIDSHLIDEWRLTDSFQPAWSRFHALRVLPDPASWCNVDFGFVWVVFWGLCESLCLLKMC